MNFLRLTVFLLAIMLFVGCNSKGKVTEDEKIDYTSFSIENLDSINYKNVGKLKKIIKLETNNDSIIGKINSISVDNESNILITDYMVTQKVFLFDKNGKFVRTIGKRGEGPGEYMQVFGASKLSDGSIILNTVFKLIKFDKDGRFLKEVKLKCTASDSVVFQNNIYLSISNYKNSNDDSAILVYNSELEKINEINKFDKRMYKYHFIPWNILTGLNKEIAFINYYDLNINLYNPIDNKLSKIAFPNENKILDSIWDKNRLERKDKNEIIKKLHRFNFIHGYNGNIFLWENCQEKKRFHFWILSLKNKKIRIYPFNNMDKLTKKIIFSLKGSYSNGVIVELSFTDENEFNEFRKEIPLLSKYEFNIDNNSYLAFFEFNES